MTDQPSAPSAFSACIEMLFRADRPGALRDRVLGSRDLLAGRHGPLSGRTLAAAARLLLSAGAGDPFPARIRACAALGWIDAVEFWSWRNKDLAGIERALGDTGLRLAAFLAEPSGHLVDPGTHPAFMAGLRESLAVARRLRARSLIVLAGDRLPAVDPQAQRAALVAALKAAAPLAAEAEVVLILEPLNSRIDHPGSFLDRTAEGLDIVEEVGHPALRLLHDVYHSVVMGEDPAQLFRTGRGTLVGHVHLADVPGRREPGSGTIGWDRALAPLWRNGFDGPVGLEFRPSGGRTAAALDSPALDRLRGLVAASGRSAVPLQL